MGERVDLAIFGRGIAPCLAGRAIAETCPNIRLAILTEDPVIGGAQLDLVLPDLLSSEMRTLLEPAVTSEWPEYRLVWEDRDRRIAGRCWLIDPVQVWFELEELIGARAMIAWVRNPLREADGISWNGGSLACSEFIDLTDANPPPACGEILSDPGFAGLDVPVLADFFAAHEGCDFLQYVPLGGGRVLINRIGIGDRPLVASEGGVVFDPRQLTSLAWIGRLASLCEGLMSGLAAAVPDQRQTSFELPRLRS